MEYHIDRASLLERFLKYVQIDSETGNEKEMSQFLFQELVDLGMVVVKDAPPAWVGTNGFNIYGTLKGDGDLEPILFSSHMDTVTNGKNIKPKVCEDGYVRSDGTTILGGDDKAGICGILEAIVQAKKLTRRPTVEVILTVREEVGLLGAKSLDYSKISAKKGMVLDSGGNADMITTSAPGQNHITVTIHGRGAHAGIAPETGISAIQVGAEAVANMNLLRVDEETTCNIGTFSSESPTNIVAPTATLIMEVRSRNMKKLQAQTDHMTAAVEDACDKYGATCDIEVETSYEGFWLKDDHPVVQETIKACEAVGLSPKTIGSGGGSDANVFNTKGIATVNLAIGMEKVHTVNEQQNIEQMSLASEICYQMIAQAGE